MLKGGMEGLMKQAQEMQGKFQEMQDKIASMEVQGESGFGTLLGILDGDVNLDGGGDGHCEDIVVPDDLEELEHVRHVDTCHLLGPVRRWVIFLKVFCGEMEVYEGHLGSVEC